MGALGHIMSTLTVSLGQLTASAERHAVKLVRGSRCDAEIGS
jgi:hypothetical protein